MFHTPELSPRPPYEQRSLQLEIAKGCPQKESCKFCGIYEGPYTPIERDVILEDLAEIDRVFIAKPKRIFLQSGDPFALPHDDLLWVLDTMRSFLVWNPSAVSAALRPSRANPMLSWPNGLLAA